MISAIKQRRAVREFLDTVVPENKLQEILNAASFAPSANALYPWELVVVKDPATKELLSKVSPWATFAQHASVIIVVIGNEQDSSNWIEDCSIIAEHVWLETVNQELGTCWIQARDQGNAEASVKEILNIPAEKRVLCLMPIGVPAKQPEEHDEAGFDKSKIKLETYK